MSVPSIDVKSIRALLAPYQSPDLRRSLWQVINSAVPFVALFFTMLWLARLSPWAALALAPLTAGFMVRTFIIFHDCCHGSFFAARRGNDLVGTLTGILTFTPYDRWKHDHAVHHATAGDLDRRGVGDVSTWTLEEYRAAPWWKQFGYRVMRHPFFMCVFGSVIVFGFTQRISLRSDGPRERRSVWLTNFSLAALITGLILLFGWREYLLVQLSVLVLGGGAGIWLFYVQHNFEGTYWERHERWDYYAAGLRGSSFFKLPRLLQWFSGNIGFHHIHHLSSKIPNYLLPKAYRENPVFHVSPLTLRTSLRCLRLRLWDEARRRMVGWEALRNPTSS